MRAKTCSLALAVVMAAPAVAQTTGQADTVDCRAERAALEREIDLARSRGQMLRRRQLADALAALQARCKTLIPERSREARIESLEQKIRELRLELDRAEEQLRELKSGGS
jgi:chromosome segregation ATPase